MSMSDEPDRYTNAWYREKFAEMVKQYRGMCFTTNSCIADYEQLRAETTRLHERMEALETMHQEDRAEIGRLKETIDKAREAFQELKNRKNT